MIYTNSTVKKVKVKKFLGCFWLMVLLSSACWAQSTDILRIEYTQIPENDNGIKTSRYRFLMTYPIALGPEDYLFVGGEYNYLDLDVSRTFPFDFSEVEKMHIIDLNLGYLTKWNENWRLIGIVTPRLASNFTNGIVSQDFKFNASLAFLKSRSDLEKPFRLLVGVTFNSASGLPFPLPLLSYKKRFHRNWSFNLGVPRMHLEYHINDKHSLQTGALLDGYFVNIQDDILLDDGATGSAISLSAAVANVGYRYAVSEKSSFYGFIGYSFIQSGLLRDDKRNNVFELNTDGNIYFRVGFKIAIF